MGPPTGPAVVAVPAQGKDLAAFQQEDAQCRSYASTAIGGTAATASGQLREIKRAQKRNPAINVPTEVEIERFVEACVQNKQLLKQPSSGGTLILGQKGASHDEYAQPVASPWTGVAFGAAQSGAAQINWGGVSLTTLPSGATRVVTGSGTVLATFSSGGAAAMEIPNGSGKVIALGFDPGTTYLNVGKVSGGPFPGQFITAFQTGMRSILLGFAIDLGLDSARPISADNPLVEVSRLDHATGGAAILLNYNNDPVQNLQVRIPGVHGWIQSQAQQTTLSIRPDQADPTLGVVELDLDDIDVLTWGSPSLG